MSKSNLVSRTDTDTDPELDEYAAAIHAIGKQSVFTVGKIRSAAKVCARPGRWLPWLSREFGWTARTAQRMMNVANKSDKLSHLAVPISALYLLAAQSIPAELIEAIAERSEQGERLSLAEVKGIIAEAEARDDEDDEVEEVDAEDSVEEASVHMTHVHYVEPPPVRPTVVVPYYVKVDQPAPVSRTITYTSAEAEDPATLRIREAAKNVRWNFRAFADALTEHHRAWTGLERARSGRDPAQPSSTEL
jgi:hypothetical protein